MSETFDPDRIDVLTEADYWELDDASRAEIDAHGPRADASYQAFLDAEWVDKCLPDFE